MDDAKDNLELYKSKGLKAIFTMFSFECPNNDNCLGMMTGPARTDAYINNGLKPFLNLLKQYKDQVYAIEMFNEPEWMIEGGSGVNRKASK